MHCFKWRKSRGTAAVRKQPRSFTIGTHHQLCASTSQGISASTVHNVTWCFGICYVCMNWLVLSSFLLRLWVYLWSVQLFVFYVPLVSLSSVPLCAFDPHVWVFQHLVPMFPSSWLFQAPPPLSVMFAFGSSHKKSPNNLPPHIVAQVKHSCFN